MPQWIWLVVALLLAMLAWPSVEPHLKRWRRRRRRRAELRSEDAQSS